MTLEEQLVVAEGLARKWHFLQFRRDGVTPYIRHIEAVVAGVNTIEEKIVAWLHDILEDTKITVAELLAAGIASKYVNAVVLLTKTPGYDHIKYMMGIKYNPITRNVKTSDMRANLADTPTAKQIKRYTEGIAYLSV